MAKYRIVEYENSFHGRYYELHRKFLCFWMKIDESLFVDILERQIQRLSQVTERKRIVKEYGT